jgi:hypothetical protein
MNGVIFMSNTDKQFFMKHYNEIKSILEKNGVSKALISFDLTFANLFLEFSPPKSINDSNVENDLMDLCQRNETAYFIQLCGFRAFGQALPIPEDAIPFEQLNQPVSSPQMRPATIDLPPLPSPGFFALKNSQAATPTQHDAAHAMTEQLAEVSAVINYLRQNEAVWKSVKNNPNLLNIAAANLSSKHSPSPSPQSRSPLRAGAPSPSPSNP